MTCFTLTTVRASIFCMKDETTAKVGVLDALNQLQDFNQQNPNTMIMQFFLQNRSEEFIGIFKRLIR